MQKVIKLKEFTILIYNTYTHYFTCYATDSFLVHFLLEGHSFSAWGKVLSGGGRGRLNIWQACVFYMFNSHSLYKLLIIYIISLQALIIKLTISMENNTQNSG